MFDNVDEDIREEIKDSVKEDIMTLRELLNLMSNYESFYIMIDKKNLYPGRKSPFLIDVAYGVHKKDAISDKYLNYEVIEVEPGGTCDSVNITLAGREGD